MFHTYHPSGTATLLLALLALLFLAQVLPSSATSFTSDVTDDTDTTCSAAIYPINVFTAIPPNTRSWKLGLIGQYPQPTSEEGGLIRFAVDYINKNTAILVNCSLELYEADTGTTSIPQSTTIASVAEIMLEGVRGLVGGNSLDIMTSAAQASADFSVPHVGATVQDVRLSVKGTFPFMMRAIPSYREQMWVIKSLFLKLGWYGALIVSTSDTYGTDAGNYILGSTELKAIPFKFKQEVFATSQYDFLKKTKNFYTDLITYRVVVLFTTPDTGYPLLKYLNITKGNSTVPPFGEGVSYVLSQAMCEPLLNGNDSFREYYPLIDGTICMYPRGGDQDSELYSKMNQAWQTANQTLYPGDRSPASFNWYGVDGVFAHAYALSSLLQAGAQVGSVKGADYLNALKGVRFNGTTGPFAFDSTYDRRGVWDIYNNIYDNNTGILQTKWVGVYRWTDEELYTESDFVFWGGSTNIHAWNASAPLKNGTAPIALPTLPPYVLRDYRPAFSGGLAVILGLCTIIAFFSAFVLAFSWASFARHGPFYCALVIAGVFLSFGAGLTLLPQPTDTLCLAFPWLLGFAFDLVYGCLFIKTWVLYSVFRKAAKLMKTNLTPFHILRLISAFFLVETALMLVWTFVDPPTVRRVDLVDRSYEYQCVSDTSIFWIIFLAYKGAWLIFGSILSFLTRNMTEEYNESKSIAYAIYTDVSLVIIAVPLAISIKDIQGGVAIVEVVVISISFTFTMVVLFWRVWYTIFIGKEAPSSIDLAGTRSTSSKSSPSPIESSSSNTPSKNRTPPPVVSSNGLYLA